MSSQPSLKQWKQYNPCYLTRLQDQMQYLQISIKQEVLQMQWNWQSFFTVEKRSHPSRIQDATIIHLFKRKGNPQVCGNHRGISLLSIAGKILARVLLNRLNEHLMASTRKPVLIQERQRNNRHDFDSATASRKMPGTECGPLKDLCRPYQSIWHSQSWGTLENSGKVWLSCQIHSNVAAIPWWYACKGPNWWRVFWSMPCDKWS